ncbi:MAG TPA: 23S rRNA (pseudouridine(1915)-N(3))-methyltransferase RlmH [Acidobacteriota bacterium]|jgi:23S rRNA (pseudouridine1915-N3)-methyltransferase
MKLVLVWVGRTHDSRWRALQQDYLARLAKFVPVEIAAVKESGGDDSAAARRREGLLLEKKIPNSSTVVALDEQGNELSSRSFARFLEGLQGRGTRTVTFVMGGPAGLPDTLRQRADHLLALSQMTWGHEAVRVLLLEQLYRAFTILRGYPYHK